MLPIWVNTYCLWLLAIVIQPMFMFFVQGGVLVTRVRFKYGPSLQPGAFMRGEEERWGALLLSSGGCVGFILSWRRPGNTGEVYRGPQVQKSVPDLLVLPGRCLPHHLQLFLYFPGGDKRGEKTRKPVRRADTMTYISKHNKLLEM